MKRLAIRLSQQAGKSLVIPHKRENKVKGRSFEERPSIQKRHRRWQTDN